MYVRASFSSLYEAAEQADIMRANRRAFPRENMGELAELIVDLTGRKVVCLVHNISQGGAMVESTASILPKRLILNYENKNIRKVSLVIWKDGNLAGLKFIQNETRYLEPSIDVS